MYKNEMYKSKVCHDIMFSVVLHRIRHKTNALSYYKGDHDVAPTSIKTSLSEQFCKKNKKLNGTKARRTVINLSCRRKPL